MTLVAPPGEIIKLPRMGLQTPHTKLVSIGFLQLARRHPERQNETALYGSIDYVLNGQSVRRVPRVLQPLLGGLDLYFPPAYQNISTLRLRFLASGITGGWHPDSIADYRVGYGMVGIRQLEATGHEEPLMVDTDEGFAINNDTPTPLAHRATAIGAEGLMLIYGKQASGVVT